MHDDMTSTTVMQDAGSKQASASRAAQTSTSSSPFLSLHPCFPSCPRQRGITEGISSKIDTHKAQQSRKTSPHRPSSRRPLN